MKLHPRPFGNIKRDSKTVEMRLNDEKRRGIMVGDEVLFINRESLEELRTRVVARHEYATFAEMVKHHTPEAMGYETDYLERLKNGDHGMYDYYSAEDEARWGTLALEVKRV